MREVFPGSRRQSVKLYCLCGAISEGWMNAELVPAFIQLWNHDHSGTGHRKVSKIKALSTHLWQEEEASEINSIELDIWREASIDRQSTIQLIEDDLIELEATYDAILNGSRTAKRAALYDGSTYRMPRTVKECIELAEIDALHRKIFTIGYWHQSIQDVVRLLDANNAVLVDIRLSPYSSYNPDFNYPVLKERFGERYLSLSEWGNDHFGTKLPMQLHDFFLGLDRFLELPKAPENAVLMCACKDYDRCHRSMVVERLVRLGYQCVEHHWSVHQESLL